MPSKELRTESLEKSPRETRAETASLAQKVEKTVVEVHQASRLLQQLGREKLPSNDHRRVAEHQKRLAQHLRALAFVIGIGAVPMGVYKGMEAVATSLSENIQRIIDGLTPSAPGEEITPPPSTSDLPPEEPSTAHIPIEEAPLPETNLPTGDLPSYIIDGNQYLAEQAMFAEQNRAREQSIETGRTLGEALASTLWDDPTFRSLHSAADIERYIQAKVDETCSEGDSSCSVFHVRESLNQGLQTKLRELSQSGSASAEQLVRLSRGLRMATNGSNDHHEFSELDIALHSGRADLVDNFLNSPKSPGGSNAGTFLDQYLSPERAEGLAGVYNRLSNENRERVAEVLRGRVNELGSRNNAVRSVPRPEDNPAEAERIARNQEEFRRLHRVTRELRISLEDPGEDEEEEG